MRTAKDCQAMATEMRVLARKSPALSAQYLQMAEMWERMERESARTEGLTRRRPDTAAPQATGR
jgi:hypothetical protein